MWQLWTKAKNASWNMHAISYTTTSADQSNDMKKKNEKKYENNIIEKMYIVFN